MTDDREIEDLFRSTLERAARGVDGDPHLADRLVANARAGRQVAVPLRHRRSRRVIVSLLAAAAVVVAVATAATVTAVNADRGRPGTPQPTAPTTAVPTTPDTTSSPPSPSTQRTTATATVRVPAGFAASDVDALSDSTIFAIGNARCASGGGSDCPALARTTNGGSTWTRLGLPTGLVGVEDPGCSNNGSATGPCVRSVAFLSTKVGYVWSVRTLYATADGGRTWTQQQLGNRFVHDVVVHGTSAVRLTTGPCSARCGGQAQVSVNGGAWTDVGPSGSATDGKNVEVYATDSGFVLSLAASQGTGVVYNSADGRTWARAGSSALCGDTNVVAARDGSTFVSCGPSDSAVLFRSTDRGEAYVLGPSMPGPGTRVVAALDQNTLVVVRQSGTGSAQVLVSRDVGLTYGSPSVGGSGSIVGVDVQSARHWYLYRDDGTGPSTYFSNDQGRTWAPLTVR